MDPLERRDICLLRADNPGPFSLTGTNTWIVGRDPAYVIDPGPALDAHLDAIEAEAGARGGVAAILATHDHADHVEAVPALRGRLGGTGVAVVATGYAHRTVRADDGFEIGPLRAVATPGHAPDHLAWVAGDALFSGDAVLGTGSVFVAPDPGALRGYLTALERLRALELGVLCPGHGPVVTDPAAKLDEYLGHRADRERRLVAALDAGRRTIDELLDDAWADAPAPLRPAAAVTLAAHLDKLDEEGRLPDGVERPERPAWLRHT